MGFLVGLAVLALGVLLYRRDDVALGPWDGDLAGVVLAVVGGLVFSVALLWWWVDDPADDPALHDRLLGR